MGAATGGAAVRRAAHADRAEELAQAIDAILVREGPGGLFLRPAAERFSAPDAETINPSYYMPLALHALAAAFDLPRLARASDDGEALLAQIAEEGLVPTGSLSRRRGRDRPRACPVPMATTLYAFPSILSGPAASRIPLSGAHASW